MRKVDKEGTLYLSLKRSRNQFAFASVQADTATRSLAPAVTAHPAFSRSFFRRA